MVVHQAGPALLGVQACTRCGEILIDTRSGAAPEWWRGRVRVFLGKPKHYVATMDEATCVKVEEEAHG
jgi:hypothetical protein